MRPADGALRTSPSALIAKQVMPLGGEYLGAEHSLLPILEQPESRARNLLRTIRNDAFTFWRDLQRLRVDRSAERTWIIPL